MIKIYNKEYYQEHKQQMYEAKKKYKQKNPDKVKAWAKAYYERHKTEILENAKRKRAENNE